MVSLLAQADIFMEILELTIGQAHQILEVVPVAQQPSRAAPGWLYLDIQPHILYLLQT
jgi:hypothetical protein